MPTHKGVEVWIEGSDRRKLSYRDVTINLVDADDRTVTAKTEMLRDELYTVHCLSPISVVCDVIVATASGVCKNAARFYLDKSLARSENVHASSMGHTSEEFKDHGLRTPKRQFQHGKLGTVEVEIRRIGEVIRAGLGGKRQTDEDEEVDFMMIDEPDQPPWIIFRFNISVKSVAVPASAALAEHVRRRPHCRMSMNQRQNVGAGSSNEMSHEIGHGCRHNPKKRLQEHDSHDASSGIVDKNLNPIDTDPDLLEREYLKEDAEEQRLLLKLQERLQTKKARNTKLRRLLGEPT